MRDEQQSHAALSLLGKQQIGDLATGIGVEISRRLVGDEEGGRRRKCARDGDALLFAAGKLAWIVAQPLAEPNRFQLAPGDVERVLHVREFQGNCDVFKGRHIGDQMKRLEDDADIAAAEIGDLIFAEGVQRCVVDVDLAAIELLKTGEDHQQRGLTGTGGADDANRLAGGDRKVDAFQYMHGGCSIAQRQICLLELDHGFCQQKIALYELQRLCQSRESSMRFKVAALHIAVIAVSLIFGTSANATTINLVGFGDSLMAGYQLPPGDGFPEKLQAALKANGVDVSIANAGVSGDTTTGGLARIDWSVPDGTNGVILELGANDALRGIAPQESEKNLDTMIARLKGRGIAVLLVGMMAPPNMGADYAARFNPIYQKLAEKHKVPLYAFFLDGIVTDASLKLEDGMHPNAKGIDVMVQKMEPAVTEFIGTISTVKK
jgi:acyl-CoA thioesterase-1